LGLTRDNALSILGVSRHQYYYRPKGKRAGKKPSQTTKKKEKRKVTQLNSKPNTQIVLGAMEKR